MTKLEKRQIMLLARYQKEGIHRFAAFKGALFGLTFAVVDFLQPENFPHPPSLIGLLFCLGAGWLSGYALWFFAGWYLGRIKKRLDLQNVPGEAA
jgi:hypothetical protein